MDSGGVSIAEVINSGDKNGLRLLLASGADVNQTNKGGQTPLILAIVSGHTGLLQVLLDAGADPLLRDNTALNAIEWAERKGLPDVARQLKERSSTGLSIPPTERSQRFATRERYVEPSPSSSQPVDVSNRALSDDEKSRRWIAGLKQRLDEKATRLQSDSPTTGQAITQENTTSSPAGSHEPTLPPPVIAAEDDEEGLSLPSEPSPSSEVVSSEGSTARKKCPQCNTVYNSDLVAYCAYHVVPLVDINAPIEVPAEDTSNKTLFLWLLVVATFLGAALIGLLLFLPWGNRTEQTVSPPSSQTPIPTWKGTPVADSALKTKVIGLPAAETLLKIEKPETIVVRVRVDSSGHVSSVQSPAGNDELRRASMDAARKATFSAERLRGRQTAGTITYTFNP